MMSESPAKNPYIDRPWLDATAKPFISIKQVGKRFGEFTAIKNVDLEIYQGELFSLLGGSGCGKTTLLRMLAGFELPSSGTITIDGIDMTDVPPYQRPVNMMFQSYALFPHMTVANNVAYGLKRDGVNKEKITQRVDEMLALVELIEFKQRKPHQLSGGQRQRVALARALVKSPKVLLLDEPLAALDKRLREQTQFELINIQDQLGITFIVVTHDQEEAMTLSTRIAVMDAGHIIQVGEPSEVYEQPKTQRIANFIGTINSFDGKVGNSNAKRDSADSSLQMTCSQVSTPLKLPPGADIKEGQEVTLAIRPEKIRMSKSPPKDEILQCLKGEVLELAYMGSLSIYRVRVDGGKVVQVTAPNLQRVEQQKIDWEDQVYISWDPQNSMLLAD